MRAKSLPGLPRNRAPPLWSHVLERSFQLAAFDPLPRDRFVVLLYFRLIPFVSNSYETTRMVLVLAFVTWLICLFVNGSEFYAPENYGHVRMAGKWRAIVWKLGGRETSAVRKPLDVLWTLFSFIQLSPPRRWFRWRRCGGDISFCIFKGLLLEIDLLSRDNNNLTCLWHLSLSILGSSQPYLRARDFGSLQPAVFVYIQRLFPVTSSPLISPYVQERILRRPYQRLKVLSFWKRK